MTEVIISASSTGATTSQKRLHVADLPPLMAADDATRSA